MLIRIAKGQQWRLQSLRSLRVQTVQYGPLLKGFSHIIYSHVLFGVAAVSDSRCIQSLAAFLGSSDDREAGQRICVSRNYCGCEDVELSRNIIKFYHRYWSVNNEHVTMPFLVDESWDSGT
jgi:hypothetical protein